MAYLLRLRLTRFQTQSLPTPRPKSQYETFTTVPLKAMGHAQPPMLVCESQNFGPGRGMKSALRRHGSAARRGMEAKVLTE